MAPATTPSGSDGSPFAILRSPWASLSDEALLAYFRGRRSVAYFTVVDPLETTPEKIDGVLCGRFEFNAETYALADPIDWLSNPSRDVEWHIMLHKFYYAVGLGMAYERSGDARYIDRWMQLLSGWIAATPVGFIAADVTGRRVQNWIYSYYHFVTHAAHESPGRIDPAFHRRLLLAIHDQVEFLCVNLTPKRNHRTLELYAIFLAGIVFPEMLRAAHWRTFALEQTVLNMAADLLPDGVHCEMSTDYHHLVLKNYLNVRRLAANNGFDVPQAFDQALEKALTFSMHVHRPDGIAPSFSDGDPRGYLDLLAHGAALFDRADMRYVASAGACGRAPVQRAAHFPDSGYTVIRDRWGTGAGEFSQVQHLVFDAGPLGEGNHGHFDALSFELSAYGRALIVDPGRYTYSEAVAPADGVNWRVRFRGTAVHNTVCVDGLNQTAYTPKAIKEPSRHEQGSMRHKIGGPHAQAETIEFFNDASIDLVHGRVRSAEYDACHDRCIVLVDRRYWIVSDWLRAPTEHDYVANFQLGASDVQSAWLDPKRDGVIHSPGLLLAAASDAPLRASIVPSWVSLRYGEKHAAPAVRCALRARDADLDTVLLPWHTSEADVQVDRIRAGIDNLAVLRVEIRDESDHYVDHWFHARSRERVDGRVGPFRFSGRWLHWRASVDGTLRHATTHGGARLRIELAASMCERLELPV